MLVTYNTKALHVLYPDIFTELCVSVPTRYATVSDVPVRDYIKYELKITIERKGSLEGNRQMDKPV